MSEFDWDDLKVLLAVGRTGKLSLAATRLRADHATVSRRISALEQALDVKLIERRPTGCSLTHHGARLMATAEDMERQVMAAQAEILEAALPVAGKVRIGAPEGFGSYFLAPRLGKLCDEFPALQLELVAMPTLFSLSKREADLAIGLSAPEQGKLYSRKITDYRLGLYAGADYFLTHEPVRSTRDLKKHRIIGYIEDLVYAVELANLVEIDEAAHPILRSSNLIAQLQATIAGAGICVLPGFIAEQEPRLVPVLAKEFSLKRSLHLVVHSDLRDLARIKATSDFIVQQVHGARAMFLGAPEAVVA
ncbi:MAG: LysR family transcriptional regulator [Caulobacterales bacterium]